MFGDFVKFVRNIYETTGHIPLHAPHFCGNEKKYLNDCIDSTFVSSVGEFVCEFENKIESYTNSGYAIATNSGTSALHISLLLAGVSEDDEVITQPLTFVATCNSIRYCGASPVFIDVDKDTMGLSPYALEIYLKENTSIIDGKCINNLTGRIIKACVPMHTFGNPCRIDEINKICNEYCICLIEDAAESLGSFYKGKHTGTFGKMGVISFNGNKIVTSGGGGCIITNSKSLALKARHLTTTSKLPHKWSFSHDQIGYNYRMPNLNAALLVAQLEQLELFLKIKRGISEKYKSFFIENDTVFVEEINYANSNYWLNTVLLKDLRQRDEFLKFTNLAGISTRPAWRLMSSLPMFVDCQKGDLKNSKWLERRIVNIPSSPY